MQFTHDGRKTLVPYNRSSSSIYFLHVSLRGLIFFCFFFSANEAAGLWGWRWLHPALTGPNQLLPFVHHRPVLFFFSFMLALSGPEDLVGKLPDDVGKSWRPMIQREAGSQPSSGGAPSPSSVSSCPPTPFPTSYSAPRRRRFVSYFISIRPSWVISEETATSSSQIIYPTLLPGSRGHLYRHHLKRLSFKDAGLSFF